ncbi:uncharacterized protein BCN122_I1709 [Burkholderia cenocepacia]|nr:uncharacterized protein BCN122_I1709 [Burkholderia cenocepacia]
MGHAGRTIVTGCGCVPFGGFLRGFRGPRFRLVFVGRQQAAELAGGSRQRHGVPREESCRMACAADRILRDVDACSLRAVAHRNFV